MRWRQVRGLMRDLVKLRRSIRKGTLVDADKVLMRLGRLSERWPRGWRYVSTQWQEGKLPPGQRLRETLTYPLPNKLGLMIAAIAGILAGLLAESHKADTA